MPIYLVVSEVLYEKIPVLDFGKGPLEPYRIVELVSARSREQARYLAWASDENTFDSDCSNMPAFRTRKLANISLRFVGPCSYLDGFKHLWNNDIALGLLSINWGDN